MATKFCTYWISVYELDTVKLSGEFDGDDEKSYALRDIPKIQR